MILLLITFSAVHCVEDNLGSFSTYLDNEKSYIYNSGLGSETSTNHSIVFIYVDQSQLTIHLHWPFTAKYLGIGADIREKMEEVVEESKDLDKNLEVPFHYYPDMIQDFQQGIYKRELNGPPPSTLGKLNVLITD